MRNDKGAAGRCEMLPQEGVADKAKNTKKKFASFAPQF